jgi:lipopolysaccharide/colanic/teichoic acid biosynthesis glycosyltransferase
MKACLRFFDVLLSSLGLVVAFPLIVLLTIVGILDSGSPFFRQERIGRYQRPFILVKFRTMRRGTASVATHLADASAVTPLGRLLRRTKLDELPQLWNVLIGEMSLVGPRPCLPNQAELIRARADLRVFDVRPGVTGLAQVTGIDMSTPGLLAETDAKMIASLCVWDYWWLLIMTLSGSGAGDRLRQSTDTAEGPSGDQR